MRVSLNKIALIEKLIFNVNSLSPEEQVLYESYKILDPDFELEVATQKQTVDLIIESGRRELKQEISDVYTEIFHPKAKNVLKSKILALFRN